MEAWSRGVTGSSIGKDIKGQRKLEDPGGGLFLAEEGRTQRTKECNSLIAVRSIPKLYTIVQPRQKQLIPASVEQCTGKTLVTEMMKTTLMSTMEETM